MSGTGNARMVQLLCGAQQHEIPQAVRVAREASLDKSTLAKVSERSIRMGQAGIDM